MAQIINLPAALRAMTNTTSVVQQFVSSAAITRGSWVVFTDPNAQPLPTVEEAPILAAGLAARVVGVALEASTVAGEVIHVVVAGWCGFARVTAGGYALGAPLQCSAAATGTTVASTFLAADGNPHVAPTSVIGYAAEIIGGAATNGEVIVVGSHA